MGRDHSSAGEDGAVNRRILHIEDNRETALYVREVLLPCGYDVYHLSTPAESFAVLRRVDLILLDYRLPGMDGIEYLEFLRENFSDIPVIMTTGHGSEVVCLHAFRLGIKDYLKKPFSPAELRQAVRKGMSGAKRRDHACLPEGADDWTLQRLYTAKHYIDRHIGRKRLDYHEVLQIAGMSRNCFNRYFRQLTGENFRRYVLRKKVERARQLLAGGEHSITEIAHALGFADLPHFTRIFKRIVGYPPSRLSSAEDRYPAPSGREGSLADRDRATGTG